MILSKILILVKKNTCEVKNKILLNGEVFNFDLINLISNFDEALLIKIIFFKKNLLKSIIIFYNSLKKKNFSVW